MGSVEPLVSIEAALVRVEVLCRTHPHVGNVRAMRGELASLRQELRAGRERIRELSSEVARNRLALADKMRVELERIGPGVVFHYHEKPGERWTPQGNLTLEAGR
jgi:hypothetical protein